MAEAEKTSIVNANSENAKAQMRKGVLELCILSIISAQEVYPSDILEKLKASDLLVVEGTLYPLLTRLKDGGLLEYRWVESEKGPPRKYYRLTNAGDNALREMLVAWNELVGAVQRVTDTSPNNEKEIVQNYNDTTL